MKALLPPTITSTAPNSAPCLSCCLDGVLDRLSASSLPLDLGSDCRRAYSYNYFPPSLSSSTLFFILHPIPSSSPTFLTNFSSLTLFSTSLNKGKYYPILTPQRQVPPSTPSSSSSLTDTYSQSWLAPGVGSRQHVAAHLAILKGKFLLPHTHTQFHSLTLTHSPDRAQAWAAGNGTGTRGLEGWGSREARLEVSPAAATHRHRHHTKILARLATATGTALAFGLHGLM